MSEILLLVISAALSLVVSLATSWVASARARKQWQQERVSSARDEAYRELTRAAYQFARILQTSSAEELEGKAADVDAIKAAHEHLDDAMFMLSSLAEEKSFVRIDAAYDFMRDRALEVDTEDPALQTTGTELGRAAQRAMVDFISTVSEEMRSHIEGHH